jgi:chromosome partitioning protein
MYKLVLANNKGGVAKTTTTVNLGYALARNGYKVLVVDVDAQSNTTYTLLGRLVEDNTLFDVLIDGKELSDVILHTKEPNLDLAPSSINLSAADLLMASAPGRERKLTRALSRIDTYDFVLIDTPPNLGVLTVNALIAATGVIIPVALTTYALIGISMLETTIQELRDNLDVALPILGVVASMDDHTKNSAEVLEAVREHFGSKVFTTVIPRNIKVEEAHNRTMAIFDHAPKSTGALAYEQLTKEVLARVYGKNEV